MQGVPTPRYERHGEFSIRVPIKSWHSQLPDINDTGCLDSPGINDMGGCNSLQLPSILEFEYLRKNEAKIEKVFDIECGPRDDFVGKISFKKIRFFLGGSL